MYRRLYSLFVFALIACSCEGKVGDTIWSDCADIPFNIVTISDVCVNLIEADRCGVNITLSVQGVPIFQDSLTGLAAPQVCGIYTIPILNTKCSICARIRDDQNDPSQQCVFAEGACSVFNLPSQQIGCFPNNILKNITECQKKICPNDCSNQGKCNNGTCECNPGYHGFDCGSNEPVIEQCTQVDQLAGKVCVRLKFSEECTVDAGLYVGEEAIVEQKYPVDQLQNVFQHELCGPEVFFCTTCLKWSSLVLNSTYASGCNQIDVRCLSQSYGTYPVGCFEDTNVVPKCFGVCPNNCSNNGVCENGKCVCYVQWDGVDCSIPKSQGCTTDCGLHGTCKNGKCICDTNYEGNDCSIYSVAGEASDKNGDKNSQSTALLVVLPLGAVIVLLVLAGGAWYYLKRRNLSGQRTFNQLDLIEAEQSSSKEEDEISSDEEELHRSTSSQPKVSLDEQANDKFSVN